MSRSRLDLRELGPKLERYFDRSLDEHGARARGVDWNSDRAQEIRFGQLMKVHQGEARFTINDYGCGYGGMVDFLRDRELDFGYHGYDLNPRMIAHARELFGASRDCRFVEREAELPVSDYTVASGLLNLKLDTDNATWTDFALDTIDSLRRVSSLGFAFNMLTSYSDPPLMRDDLYYGDPCLFFDHCKRSYSRDVALLHDYGAYEFTIIVRLPGE